MTRGRAATPDPFDLSAVSSSDELFDALSERRFADLSARRTDDPAASLLAALVADVDREAPPLPTPARVACGVQGSCRRGVRAFVTFGVAAVVLTSAGAAAAGGNKVGAAGASHGSVRPTGSERSNENVQRHDPANMSIVTGDSSPSHRAGNKRRDAAPPPVASGPPAKPASGSAKPASGSEPAQVPLPAVREDPADAPADRPERGHQGHRWTGHQGRRWTWVPPHSPANSRHPRTKIPAAPPKQKPASDRATPES